MTVVRWALVSAVCALLGSAAQAQTAAFQPLVDGIIVELGNNWAVTSTDNPAIDVPEVQKMLTDAKEIRFRQGGTGILVSSQTFRPIEGKSLDFFDPAKYALNGARQFYLAQSVETEAVVEQRTNGRVNVALVTLHARSGQAFRVRSGYPGGCVSTGNIRKGWSVLVISIASESCESETHRAALSAFLGAHE